MPTYAIGDIQGCYTEFMRLLEHLNFDEHRDQLWLAGDLVNRGPESLQTLRFVQALPHSVIVLGNHDLHLIALARGFSFGKHHTLHAVLQAPECGEYVHWLRQQPLLHYDASWHTAMVHAGILPSWSLGEALHHARQVEAIIQDDDQIDAFIEGVYNVQHQTWRETLSTWDQRVLAAHVFTRMRFCTEDDFIDLAEKGPPGSQPNHLTPWFQWPRPDFRDGHILFGHWAALQGTTSQANVIALDTGCAWGERLTAFCFENQQYYSVACDIH